jgi:hypothetical protein
VRTTEIEIGQNPIHGRMGIPGGFMGDLMKKDDREIQQDKREIDAETIQQYRKKISDDTYLEHAITRIATDLSHYLTK